MVNTGHPSRACQGCRAIKSKCDEIKPSCKRCTRIGKPCVYPDTDPVFRSMNQWSETTVKMRVKNKVAAREAEELQCMEKYLPPLPPLVAVEWESQAIGPFFDRFTTHADHFASNWGFLPWLPEAFSNPSTPTLLVDATKACALANLANASKIPELDVQAGRSYGLALKGLHSAMSKRETATSNDTLATMMLLAVYEVISGAKPPKEMFQAHMQGQAAALRLRAKRRTLSDVDSSIASHTNRWLMWRDLAHRTRPTYSLSDWPPGMYRSWLDELTAQFTVKVADVCGRIQEMQEHASAYGTIDSDEEFESCVSTALSLEQSFELSLASAPADWLPVKGRPQSQSALQDRVPAHMLANRECPIINWKVGKQDNIGKRYNFGEDHNDVPYYPRVDTYPSRPVAFIWSFMRAARLHLLRAMIDLRLVAKQRENPSSCNLPSFGDLRTRVSDTIHDICAALPYLLGDFYVGMPGTSPGPHLYASDMSPSGSAAIVMWLLHKVLAVPGISSAIRAWALEVFERLGTVGNIRQGLNLKHLYSQDQPMLGTTRRIW